MREIDMASWSRREHFEFFRRADLPFYNVNANVDVTGLRECARARALSFNSVLIHVAMRAVNGVENFRYRLRGETVVLHDRLHPSFAHLKEGEELFRMITVDFVDDLLEFAVGVREAIDASNSWFGLEKLVGRDDLVFISSLPWISFTGVDHTLSLKREDAMPRLTWGKCFEEHGRTLLPFNVQVNHMFVDGLHVGRFFERLDAEIRASLERP